MQSLYGRIETFELTSIRYEIEYKEKNGSSLFKMRMFQCVFSLVVIEFLVPLEFK